MALTKIQVLEMVRTELRSALKHAKRGTEEASYAELALAFAPGILANVQRLLQLATADMPTGEAIPVKTRQRKDKDAPIDTSKAEANAKEAERKVTEFAKARSGKQMPA